ncbi:hypothetical protein EYC84_008322 [Monilinia fructicola]|uniref:Uncharacterized protein n=1 Tax=Monilinia fructicola TaxID=38448 RepID=A0A5M9JJ73_MONFR|nr:hypothetical protein EYC84_008322 [Monilinia fructicola]
MPQSSKLPSHSGKPSAAMTCSDESKTPVRRPDSPRPHFSGLPDTRINLLTGCEYVDDKTTGSWDHRSLRREESIKASTKLSSRLSRSGGYSENCNFLKTDARQIADDIGRCAQTLAEAKFNLDRANRAARTIWTMNSLKKSIEPLCKGTTAAAAGVASGADNDSPRKKVNNRNWRSASTSSIAPSFNGHHPHVLFSDSEEEQGRQVPGDFEKNHVGNLSKWKFNINVPMHTRAFGDSADHANSCKKETTGYTASDISCINDSTRANLPGDAGSIQKLNPTGSCDLLFGSTAAGGVQNGYKQPANYPEQSPFDELVQHIEYQSPHSNPRNENSFRMSTPLRPSIDPLQRPSRRPCILSSDSTLPQNRSSLPHNPTPFTLPRDPSSRPTLTSSTNSINRKPIHKPASPRPILSSQCPKLSQVHNWNLSSTLPQASSSRTKFSSHTISPVANLNITIMYGPDPTTPIIPPHVPPAELLSTAIAYNTVSAARNYKKSLCLNGAILNAADGFSNFL